VTTTDPLAEPLRRVVGDKTAKEFAKGLGLHTVGDLLYHFPRRYAERGNLTDFASLKEGDEVTVLARVSHVEVRSMRQKKGTILDVVVTDNTGSLTLTFFNQAWRAKELVKDVKGLFAGTVSTYNGKRQLTHPQYQLLGDGDVDGLGSGDERHLRLVKDDDGARDDTVDVATESIAIESFVGELIPIYPATAKLMTWRISKAVDIALARVPDLLDPIPEQLRVERGLDDIGTALRLVHRPESEADVSRALERFRYQEALILQTVLARRRAAFRGLTSVPRLARDDGLLAGFDEQLPFTLTDGQLQVAAAIAEDMARSYPMHRLLQGEVGAGKTVVALRAMLTVVDSGGQAALLAPTEVLAQQHARSIRAMLGPMAEAGMLGGSSEGTQVALLTGSLSTAQRRRALLEIASGDAGIVVGTHALIQETVDFFDLGLVVVDEQHRFGVEQRDALRAKGRQPPHVLVMTATPIPRTVAMTVFGDLEISTLAELPSGRQAIATHVVPTHERPNYVARTWERVREEVAAGHQVYIVCPRIDGDDAEPSVDDSETSGPEAAEGNAAPESVLDVAKRLSEGPLAGLAIEVLHGRLPIDQKDAVMRRFADGAVDVLVATTVIEVGVDVAAATLMVVMDADRFGVSQLHQLRGRVGRGSSGGLCLLMTRAEAGSPARERLDAVAATTDGFELSRLDLEQRREGDVLGTSQSGSRSGLQILRVVRDEAIIDQARTDATHLVEHDPDLDSEPALMEQVWLALADDRSQFMEKT